MNNTQFKRITFFAVIAATLLSVAVVTAISMVEDADARYKRSSSSSTTTSQSITQSNTGSGNSRNFNSATNSAGSGSQTCTNGICS